MSATIALGTRALREAVRTPEALLMTMGVLLSSFIVLLALSSGYRSPAVRSASSFSWR